MRKKLLGFFAVFACLLMLTACGGTVENKEISEDTKNLLYSLTQSTIQSIDENVVNNRIEEFEDYPAIHSGLESWASAKEELGNVDFTTDSDGNGIIDCFYFDEDVNKAITLDEDDNYVVTASVTGDQLDPKGNPRTVECIVVYSKNIEKDIMSTGYMPSEDYSSIVANVNYTMGEMLQQAGLNTLLGMGTTFAVLILLSLIIAAFGKVFTSWDKKKIEKEEQQKASAAAEAPAPARVSQGSLAAQSSDDDALIAVIAAAVTAYREQAEPTVAPDGFVVRKIRRIGRK